MAASCLYLALLMNNCNEWTPTLVHCTGYKTDELRECVLQLNSMNATASNKNFVTVKKYSKKIFYKVAEIPALDQTWHSAYDKPNVNQFLVRLIFVSLILESLEMQIATFRLLTAIPSHHGVELSFIKQWNEYVTIAVNRNLSNCEKSPKKRIGLFSQLLKLRFTAMVTYSFHLYSRSSHHFILCFIKQCLSFLKATLKFKCQ